MKEKFNLFTNNAHKPVQRSNGNLLLGIGLAFLLLLIQAKQSFAQSNEVTVQGKITNVVDGTPIPGVNISIKGTNRGTATDIDGNYKLTSVKPGDVLLYTFIGLKDVEVKIPENITSNIVKDIGMEEDLYDVVGSPSYEAVYSSNVGLWKKIKEWFK